MNGLLIGDFGFFAEFKLSLPEYGRYGRGFYAKNLGRIGPAILLSREWP
jgi:hypothetical protein